MKKVTFLLGLSLILFSFASCDDDDDINVNELPAVANTFLTNYFPGENITRVVRDDNEFEVYYANYKVEFDRTGIWKQVDGKRVNGNYREIPVAFLNTEIPAQIVAWKNTNYPNTFIVEVEKEFQNNTHVGYDIELSNGLDDLDFDLQGNFLYGGGVNPPVNPPVTSTLPQAATTFLTTYFGADSVIYSRRDDDGDYEVRLTSGIQIEFDVQGIWDNVDGKFDNGKFVALPELFITTELPAALNTFVATNYIGRQIIQVDKEYNNNRFVGYEVDLNGNVELDFDVNGTLIGSGGSAVVTLPQAAQDFMNIHFPGSQYMTILDEGDYDVYIGATYRLEFDLQGAWTKVDGLVYNAFNPLPASFLALPPVNTINSYIAANYQGRSIAEIEKDYDYGVIHYDVELDNGMDLIFDANGSFMRIDY